MSDGEQVVDLRTPNIFDTGTAEQISIVKPVIKGLITTFIILLPPKTKANL